MVLKVADDGSVSVDAEVALTFKPGAVAYDIAYSVFYVANAEPVSGVPMGKQVTEVGMDGTARPLFTLSEANGRFVSETTASSMFYSPYTGTIFILCNECSTTTVFEVTRSGNLRSMRTSLLELRGLPEEPKALTFHQSGSPMLLLLNNTLEVSKMCQDIPETLPVLGPYSGQFNVPQTWLSLDSYKPCGDVQLEDDERDTFGRGPPVVSMAIDGGLRTIWAYVDGSIREYSMSSGRILRELSTSYLSSLGIDSPITSMSWITKNKLLLGMQEGNRLAVLHTAPPSAQAQVLERYRQQQGLPPGASIETPPGPDTENSIVRDINQAEVIDMMAIEFSSNIPVGPNSLTSVAYDSEMDSALFTTTDSGATVFEVLFDDDDDTIMGGKFDLSSGVQVSVHSLGDGVSVEGPIASLLYSPAKDGFLMWNVTNLYEVGGEPPAIMDPSMDFTDLVTSVATPTALTMTRDGYLLLFADSSGRVYFDCGVENEESDDLADRSRSGADDSINPDYFWGAQQQASRSAASTSSEPPATRGGASESTGGGVYITKFFVKCLDPAFSSPPAAATVAECRGECDKTMECGAYTFTVSGGCELKWACEEKAGSADATSGVKDILASLPKEPSASDDNAGSSRSGELFFFHRLPNIGCRPRRHNIWNIFDIGNIGECEAECSTVESCGGYTYVAKDLRCILKRRCKRAKRVRGRFSGVKAERILPDPTPAPTPRPFVETFVLHKNKGCKDPTLGSAIRDVDFDKCQERCNANSDCKAFTFNRRSDCFLKKTCKLLEEDEGDTSAILTQQSKELPPPAPIPSPPVIDTRPPPPDTVKPPPSSQRCSSNPGQELVGGWTWRGKNGDCLPWTMEERSSSKRSCGAGASSGIKIGPITWQRMFAHKANPLRDGGDCVMEWTPYRQDAEDDYGGMYHRGAEILGHFDNALTITEVGDEVEVAFKWFSDGETLSQEEFCGPGTGSDLWDPKHRDRECADIDDEDLVCEVCGGKYSKEMSQRYIYHEVRCLSGTGDFRVSLLDTSRGEKVTKDGYTYFNQAVTEYRGLQWRIHPHSCPEMPRYDADRAFAAVSAKSFIRNACCNADWLNSMSLSVDYIEKDRDTKNGRWRSDLGDTRSFKDDLYSPNCERGDASSNAVIDPRLNHACFDLPVGEWTPDDKPLVLKVKILEKNSQETTFLWGMSFNGWEMPFETFTWENDRVPQQIDSIAIAYANERSYTSLKLKMLSFVKRTADGTEISGL